MSKKIQSIIFDFAGTIIDPKMIVVRKKAYAETFKRANKDPEMLAQSDWGLQDYRQQLNLLEK